MNATSDESAHDQRAATLAISFVWGVMAGAVAALLLAPASGHETTARLEANARDLRERASRAIGRGRAAVDRASAHLQSQAQHASHIATEARQALTEIRERGEHAVATIRREATAAVTDARTAYREARAEIEGERDAPS